MGLTLHLIVCGAFGIFMSGIGYSPLEFPEVFFPAAVIFSVLSAVIINK